MKHIALSLALAMTLILSAAAQDTGYLYFAGGAVPAPGDAFEGLDYETGSALTTDNGLFSVLVANVNITTGTVYGWRRAGSLLPEDNPNTASTTEAYAWMFLENAVHVYNDRLYVGPGDWNGDASRDTADVVAYADINEDGSLGAFSLSDPIISDGDDQAICATAVVEVGGTAYYYVIGGTGSGLDRIAYAAISSVDGSLGAWATTTGTLLGGDWFNRATTTSAGTIIHSAGNLVTTRQISHGTPAAGGDIASMTDDGVYDSTAGARWDNGLVTVMSPASNEFAVIFGGSDGGGTDTTFVAPVTAGVPGTWTSGNPMPAGRRRHTGVGVDDLIIQPGGGSGSSVTLAQSTVFLGRVDDAGVITWSTSPTPMIQNRSFGGAAFYRTDFPPQTNVEGFELYR